MSIRQTLINQFIQSLHCSTSNEIVTLLALIGIETVLMEQRSTNHSVIEDVTMIKKSVKMGMQQNEQTTVKSEAPRKRERNITPKITELEPPVNVHQQMRKVVQRHHLDDNAMKMALSQQYDFDTLDTNVTSRTRSNQQRLPSSLDQIKSPKSTISESLISPKVQQQSVQYYIDFKGKHNQQQNTHTQTQNIANNNIINQTNSNQKVDKRRQLNGTVVTKSQADLKPRVQNYEKELKQIQQGLTNEMLIDYQSIIEQIKKHPTLYNQTLSTPEESLQEKQIKAYLHDQLQISMQPQQVNAQFQCRSVKHSEYQENQQSTSPCQGFNLKTLQSEERTTSNNKSSFHQEKPQYQHYHQQQRSERLQQQQQQQLQLSDKPTPIVQKQKVHELHAKKPSTETLQSENTFSCLQSQKGKNHKNSNDNSGKYQTNLSQVADELLTSPIIRQISIKSEDKVSPQSLRQEYTKEIQVSNFDSSQQRQFEHDSLSSHNSSAFSLFQPNEELKSFFRKELAKEEVIHDENNDPNCVKYSNVFLKGRMGGSKVF